jgi:hypothetical protein
VPRKWGRGRRITPLEEAPLEPETPGEDKRERGKTEKKEE